MKQVIWRIVKTLESWGALIQDGNGATSGADCASTESQGKLSISTSMEVGKHEKFIIRVGTIHVRLSDATNESRALGHESLNSSRVSELLDVLVESQA